MICDLGRYKGTFRPEALIAPVVIVLAVWKAIEILVWIYRNMPQ